jgi:hypothetical protein
MRTRDLTALSSGSTQATAGTFTGGGFNQATLGTLMGSAFNHATSGAFTGSSGLTPTGTVFLPWRVFETAVGVPLQRMYWTWPDILPEATDGQQIFDAIQSLYLSTNKPRDRQIAERLTALYRDALEEDEHILPTSLSQFTEFFLTHTDLGFPRITLTPDGTLRVRWIQEEGNFVAIEFTGKPEAKLVAEIPGLVPPMHFSSEFLTNIVEIAQAMGGSFA